LLTFAVKLLNQAIYDRLMKCLITSLRFELFENIIHMELDSTVTNNEAISNIAIAKRCCVSGAALKELAQIAMSLLLVRSQGERI
jgi:hypothetical protein